MFALALATRAVAAARVALIERDGVDYLVAASRLARGDTSGAVAHYYPPAYPAAVASVARLIGSAPGEYTGQGAAALAGAGLAVLVALAGSLAFGRRAGLFAGLVAALHPSCVEQAAKVTADSLFSALALGSVVATVAALTRGRSSRPLLALAGALAAASYLARPEGIVVLGAVVASTALVRRLGPGPSRATAPAWVLLPGALVALGYVVAIKPQAALTGRDAGVWKLTKKRELFLEAGGERAFPRGEDGARHLDLAGAREVATAALGRAAKQLWLTAAEGNLALGVAALGAFGGALGLPRSRRRALARAPDVAERALRVAAGGSALALLAAYSLIRTDARYGAILFVFALPFAGAGLELVLGRASGWPTGRSSLGHGWPRASRALLAALLLVHLGVSVRPRLERKAEWRAAGERCGALGLDPVASPDPRVAFYGGVALVDLAPILRREEPRDPDARAATLSELARSRGARAIVVGDTHPDEHAVVASLATRLGAPLVFEHEGRERVVLFRLDGR